MRVDVGWERLEPISITVKHLFPMSRLCATHMKTKRWNRSKRFRLTETIYMNLKRFAYYLISKRNKQLL